jgi:hypothetical protein
MKHAICSDDQHLPEPATAAHAGEILKSALIETARALGRQSAAEWRPRSRLNASRWAKAGQQKQISLPDLAVVTPE